MRAPVKIDVDTAKEEDKKELENSSAQRGIGMKSGLINLPERKSV